MSIAPGALETIDEPIDVGAVEGKIIEGRSLGQIAWARFRKDKVAVSGGIIAGGLILLGVVAWPLKAIGWIHPAESNQETLRLDNAQPNGGFSGASLEHPLGVTPGRGVDIMDQVIEGAQISLTIAFAATFVAVGLGVLIGGVAGYFGGWIDSILSRFMDLMLAFPTLLFSIALMVVARQIGHLGPLEGLSLQMAAIIFILGFFAWAYPARIIRGQVISLREKEFVEAARSLGARDSRILAKELLPNMVGPILIYSSLIIPATITAEAALSFLGVGILPPTATWGQMISNAAPLARINPFYLIVPSIALFITVLAFNLLGDGIRDAIDPKSSR